jgi:N-acetyl-gamma-glutamyl-phosphate reductase
VSGRSGLRAAVIGAAGYVGGEALRLLHGHARVASVRAFSRSQAGKRLAELHPSLAHVTDARFEAASPEDAARDADVVLFALGHGESAAVVPAVLAGSDALVVDLAQDFRLDPAWIYALCDPPGLPLAGTRRIAAPGCFATATLLALFPAARSGLVEGVPASFAITGSSGAGVTPKLSTHHPVRAHNLFAYALDGHRHEAEIAAQARRWSGPQASCRLLPHSGPFVRGIHATLRARLRAPLGDPVALYREAYAGRPFVRVLDAPPELSAVVGTNFAHLHAVVREDGRELIVTCVIDNLVKGAAGQALQAMNLALGFGETEGLVFPGIYPC